MDDMSYRAPVRPNFTEDDRPPVKDEVEYSTLTEVQKILDQSLFDLEKNFNSFSVLSAEDPEEAARKLLVDVASRQIAYSIISTAKAAVDNAIGRVSSLNRKKK